MGRVSVRVDTIAHVAEVNPAEDPNRRRFDRVRLLSEELDHLNADAGERNTSVLNKASFLAVSAGVVVAASTAHVWTELGVVGIAALFFAAMSLGCATVALRPGKRIGIQARRLVDRHLDCGHSAAEVEAELVGEKATVLAAREEDMAARARWVWYGFASLILSTVSLTVVFAFETLGGM